MPEGISIDIDGDGNIDIARDDQIEAQECFGGVMCEHLHTRNVEEPLNDGTSIVTNKMWCDHIDTSVLDIFYDSPNSRCPLDYWVKAVMPKYYPPVTPSEEPE